MWQPPVQYWCPDEVGLGHNGRRSTPSNFYITHSIIWFQSLKELTFGDLRKRKATRMSKANDLGGGQREQPTDEGD